VAHACNPSYSGGTNEELGSGPGARAHTHTHTQPEGQIKTIGLQVELDSPHFVSDLVSAIPPFIVFYADVDLKK
jgi:hypothetical protein